MYSSISIKESSFIRVQRDLIHTKMDEQKRRLSIKGIPMSLLLPSSSGKSYAINIMDTPGYANLIDEVCKS